MKPTPWVLILCLSLAACSGSKSTQKVSEQTPQIELSDSDELSNDSDSYQGPSEEAASEKNAETSEVTDNSSELEAEPEKITETNEVSDAPEVTAASNGPLVEESSIENPIEITNEPGTVKKYLVQKNETLMMIAFKIYGDYGRWKEIANFNSDLLKGSNLVGEGMTLSYEAPAKEFNWNPQGTPYLIRTGDTLGRISKQVYATEKKWKLLWDNNKPLIKDPNKIYAGFSLYYLESGREVAYEF